MNRIFITGGHLTPALAVIEELQKNSWEIFYIGRKHSLEGDAALSVEFQSLGNIKSAKFLSITTGRLQRRFSTNTIPSLLKIPIGFAQSLFWLHKFRPKIILSFGGYVGVPVALAGWILQIPVVIHEQTLVPSLSSKIISPLAAKILVSWPQMKEQYPSKKVVLTGNPIRQDVFIQNKTEMFQTFSKIQQRDKRPVLYVTGGNQGAHSINEIVKSALHTLLDHYIVIHQCGSSEKYQDFEKLQEFSNSLPPELRQRYFLNRYIDSPNIGWVLNNCSVIIGRSGANTISEVAALGKIAILIPLPWSGGKEQQENAQLLEKFGGAKIIAQENFNGQSLTSSLSQIFSNLKEFQQNAQKCQQLIVPGAAAKIVSELN